ncbi:Hypothetical predicted protein [Cloeon dipterum]|uniref:C2H2-type domain-containing protein n=1 Tax=Cloeon dipterum TaxID=197152 RepID=A0A8S1DAP2_9INSE|nr:Hypothetical predicted protein [Cloeon dipterum]
MSIQKALCLICECPTADGAVTAVHVDKNKLETWFLNVCEYEMDEEIYDDDLICYFCLWHAEFQWKLEEMADENLVWWPRNSEHLDDAAKKLRKKYFEGKLEQCWVQLEIIELPQSALCLICECPTADGAVTAVHVDKNKLETWFLNVCEYEIDEEIYDDDLICYFCLWHAEFQWKLEEMADENLVWWPRNSEHLDNAAKELRKKYFEGKLEQCWVQLKIIELPRSVNREERRNVQAEIRPRRWKCIYCGKRYKYSFNMYKHVKKMHKEAIRCENVNCATYFHTREEKEEHKKNVHDKQKEREKINCSFCGQKSK